MALGTPTAPVAMASATAASATTGSFTPGASVALFAFVTARKLSATITTPTVSDSVGLTWHALGNVNHDPGSNPRLAAQLYVAFPGASPSAMTVTCSSTGAGQTGVTLVEVTGASQSSSDYSNVIVSSVNSSGDPSATLGSSPAAASGVIAFAFMNATNTITSPSGFTAVQESTIGSAYRVESAYDITSPTAGAHAWSSTNTQSFGFLIEIKEPASGALSLTADTGSFALSGQAASLNGTRKLIAALGGYSLTGQAATLQKTSSLVASNGSFVLAGQAAALLASRSLITASGSFALTGQPATARVARLLGFQKGSFDFTGIAAQLNRSGNLFDAAVGTFAYTGNNADLRAQRRLQSASGTFALSGQSASLRGARRLVTDAGALSLIGQAASLLRGQAFAAAHGQFTLSGIAMTPHRTRAIAAATGAISLTASPMQFLRSRQWLASSGTFIVDGRQATFIKYAVAPPNARRWSKEPTRLHMSIEPARNNTSTSPASGRFS